MIPGLYGVVPVGSFLASFTKMMDFENISHWLLA